MSYFVCPECGEDTVRIFRMVPMIEIYTGDDVETEEDLTYERCGDSNAHIECLECGYEEYGDDLIQENWAV